MAVSEAQKKASKKWEEKNKEYRKYTKYKGYAKKFILEIGNTEDIVILKKIIDDKLNK